MAIYFEQYNDHLRRKYHHLSTPFYSRIQAPFQHCTRSLGTERGGDTRGYFIVLAFIRQSPNNTESKIKESSIIPVHFHTNSL